MSDGIKELEDWIYDFANRELARKYEQDPNSVTEEVVKRCFHEFYNASRCIGGKKDVVVPNEEAFIRNLVERYMLKESYIKPRGFACQDEETRLWLTEEAKEDIHWHYWNLYRKYLITEKKWGERTVRSMDDDTNGILNRMADPRQKGDFDRRGLVVASVQSGKTANYIGLIAKAADAGYRIIIVMAGIHNVLRNQTQERIEDGFVGFNSIKKHKTGVGEDTEYQPEARPLVGTSRIRDFNKGTGDVFGGINPQTIQVPMVFVVKKNARVLESVKTWLRISMGVGRKEQPLLLIDDEADNASINVKYGKDEVSRINGQIRDILGLFSKSAYVGYTATPFANVLIDSKDHDEEHGDDIFPKSFIYTLEQSDAYFGAEKVFGDIDEARPKHYREIVDPPEKSDGKPFKSGDQLEYLPESLKRAIRTFVVACAERLLSGDASEHMTMMINLSPYNSVQKSARYEVKDYLEEIKDAVSAFANLPPTMMKTVKSPMLSELKQTWQREYDDGHHTWDDLLSVLCETVAPIRVAEINSTSKDSLGYDLGPQRVIAIGGYRLSRGLTLEGLMISYYARNARAYDSLMQMARWFGYRMGYERLCRVWISEESAHWYQHVAMATRELMDQIETMCASNATPKQYGLRIRCNLDALMITARDKTGAGERLRNAKVLLDGNAVQTAALSRRPENLQWNEECAVAFLEKLKDAQFKPLDKGMNSRGIRSGLLFRNVPSKYISDYLGDYRNCPQSFKTDPRALLEHINLLDERGFTRWFVYVAAGDKDASDSTFTAFGKTMPREQRRPSEETDSETFYFVKRSITSRAVEEVMLTDTQIARAKQRVEKEASLRDKETKKNLSGFDYRQVATAPLLVLHPVVLRFDKRGKNKDVGNYDKVKKAWPSFDHSETTVGWSISFPIAGIEEPVEYMYNDVMLREARQDDLNTEVDEDAPDEV